MQITSWPRLSVAATDSFALCFYFIPLSFQFVIPGERLVVDSANHRWKILGVGGGALHLDRPIDLSFPEPDDDLGSIHVT